jgi:hypothetical protein
MKQTAVEWYEKEINSLLEKYESKEISTLDFIIIKHNIFERAKEMEKEQQGYSKKDMIEFANFKTSNIMKHSDSKGFYLGDEKVFNLWFEQFKNNDRKINNTKRSS